MPEFTKFNDANGFFPGQCFTCGTAEGPFYLLGEAAGYGVVIIHPHCVIELARLEGMIEPYVPEQLCRELTAAEEKIEDLENELRTERNSQMKVISLETARKLVRPAVAKKPKEPQGAVT